MDHSLKTSLKQEKEELLKRLAEIELQLGNEAREDEGWMVEPLEQEPRRRRRPLRSQCLDMLESCGFMLYSNTISQLLRAQYGLDVASTRFGTLSSDEQKAFEKARPQPVYLCHGLTHDRGEAIKRLWARADWPLEQRVVGPITGRVLFLKLTIWINGLAEEAAAGASPAARPELLMYLAADCSRDLGFRVRKGDRDFDKWREAALDELEKKEDDDLAQRREAATRLVVQLIDVEQHFGAREGLTVLPGTQGDWRTTGK